MTGCCAWTPTSASAMRCALRSRPSDRSGFARAAGYRFARLSEYFGKFLRHGNAYPDRVLRLFDRRRGGWRGAREIHEAASVDGVVATLAGDLIHHPYRSLEQQLQKTQRYARMMAEHEFARGKRASLAKLVLSPAWRFWRGYVFRRWLPRWLAWPGLRLRPRQLRAAENDHAVAAAERETGRNT